jgi:hypothetical protein
MLVVHLVGEIPGRIIQAAKAIKGQSACLKPVLATVALDVPGASIADGINVHKTGNYNYLIIRLGAVFRVTQNDTAICRNGRSDASG